MTIKVHRVRAKIGFKKTNAPDVIAGARRIYTSCNGDAARFSSLAATLVTFLAALISLEAAEEVATRTKARGSASARDVKINELWTLIEGLLKAVQALADASPEQAVALIEASGFKVAETPVHAKAILDVALHPEPGTAVLKANAKLLKAGRGKARSTQFNWRFCAKGAEMYTNAPSTPIATCAIMGLTPGIEHEFQVCITDSQGTTEWSQAASIVVR